MYPRGMQSYVTTPDNSPQTQLNQSGAGSPQQVASQLGYDVALRVPQSGTIAAAPDVSGQSAFAWLMAFAVMIFLLWLINKTRIGHALIYYLLVIAVVSLLLINYRWLAGVLSPLTQFTSSPVPSSSSSSG